MSSAVIETRGLTKTYSSGARGKARVDAVADLDLDVGAGEIFAFLGPNGAGKTTTINLLMGFLRPTRGRVALFGADPEDRSTRLRVGYLPENYAFYPYLKAPDLLDFFGRLFRIPGPERRKRIEQLLYRLGLWDARDRAIGKYSRGMRQRLGIVQALLNEPELLILDEPTSGFDPVGRRMVRDLLLEIRQRGTCVFLSSHILSEVEAVCDRVAIVHRGRLVRLGTIREVIGSHAGFEILFTDPEGTVGGGMRQGSIEAHEDHFRVLVEREDDAQAIIDTIRACGGVIKSYAPRARSLEDVFLQHVGDPQAPRLEEASK